MKNSRRRTPTALVPFASGQVWQLGDSRLKISAVGKLLVHYKQCKGAAASPVCLCGKSKFEELLRRHRAVLLTEAENQAPLPTGAAPPTAGPS